MVPAVLLPELIVADDLESAAITSLWASEDRHALYRHALSSPQRAAVPGQSGARSVCCAPAATCAGV